MVWTYSGNPASGTVRDEVRFLIGDTNVNDQQLQNEEVDYCIVKYAQNAYKAGSLCCRRIASKYSRMVDTSIETLREQASQLMEHYLYLAEMLWAESTEVNPAPIPFVGGVSISNVLANRENTDRVVPAFRNNLFDNPLAGDSEDLDDDFDPAYD